MYIQRRIAPPHGCSADLPTSRWLWWHDGSGCRHRAFPRFSARSSVRSPAHNGDKRCASVKSSNDPRIFDQDKLAGIGWRPGRSGAPILEEALAYLDCELTKSLRVGDHELVVGRVIDGRILTRDAAPMAYAETGDMDGSSALYPAKF